MDVVFPAEKNGLGTVSNKYLGSNVWNFLMSIFVFFGTNMLFDEGVLPNQSNAKSTEIGNRAFLGVDRMTHPGYGICMNITSVKHPAISSR